MKRLSMICMAALLMMAVSCKKENKTSDKGEGFRATIESHSGDSKTHLEGLAVKWDNGDAIKVLSNTCTEGADFSTDATSSPALFVASGDLPTDFYTPNYTAYYPAASFSGDQLTLPPTQQYDEHNTFASGANPMAAASSETLLPFKNVCGVLKLQLYSATACQVQSISITSNNDEQLHGTGAVGFDADNNPTLGTLSDGGSTLTLDMGSTGKAMSTSESAPTAYYFVVPTGTLGTSFTVKVTETNGKVWTKTANATANLIARSQITVLPEQAVTTKTPVSPSEVTVTASCSNEDIYTLGGSVTVPEGEHTCEFGLVYSETDNTPTIEEGAQKVIVGTDTFSGTQSFTADITGLTVGTTYHVRAYAMIDGVTYSTGVKDIVGGDGPQPMTWTGGKSPYLFTVADPTPGDPNSGDETKVRFSQGNLQYIGSAATPYWKFADHQFDFIGNGQDGSDASNIDRDLFGWGTSGYNHNGKSYQPWSTSTKNKEYYAYSTSTHTYNLYDQSGMADWGKANSISNGGGSSWRTLTKDEWVYLINTRKDSNDKLLYGEGKVGSCIPGLIILPDDWSCPTGVTDVSRGTLSWSNVYSYSQWAQLEAAGAVFLPAAGNRYGTSVSRVGSDGDYWSSSSYAGNYVYFLYFYSGNVSPSFYNERCYGRSVRLVSEN